MTTTNTNPKPRRRWLQFSLRGLLLLMVVVAVPLGWTMHKVRQQRVAVAALEKMGCEVHYEDIGKSSAPEWLRKLLGESAFRNVTAVVGSPRIADADLVCLKGLNQLQNLLLNGTQITDVGLVHLQGLSRLQYLNLERTHITDAGLLHVQGLTQLKILVLRGTLVTDAGLANLRELNHLESLYLDGTQVTGAGLVYLRGLTLLQELWLRPTPAIDAGVQELQKALPNLRVYRVN